MQIVICISCNMILNVILPLFSFCGSSLNFLDPKSIQGHLLLHRSTFSLGGHMPTTMTLLPRTKAASIIPPSPDAMDIAADATIPEHEILITSSTGAISLLSPLGEAQYRRLSTLTSHLTN